MSSPSSEPSRCQGTPGRHILTRHHPRRPQPLLVVPLVEAEIVALRDVPGQQGGALRIAETDRIGERHQRLRGRFVGGSDEFGWPRARRGADSLRRRFVPARRSPSSRCRAAPAAGAHRAENRRPRSCHDQRRRNSAWRPRSGPRTPTERRRYRRRHRQPLRRRRQFGRKVQRRATELLPDTTQSLALRRRRRRRGSASLPTRFVAPTRARRVRKPRPRSPRRGCRRVESPGAAVR